MTRNAFPTSAAVIRAAAVVGLAVLLGSACATGGGVPEPSEPEPEPADTAERESGEAAVDRSVDRPGERARRPAGASALPAIPERTGPVRLRVEYPDSLRLVRPDTNFIFGTVGTGDARLWIGGRQVEVEPNGAFLAWLPVPEATADGRRARYRLVARRATADTGGAARGAVGAADSTVLEHPIRRPGPGYAPPDQGAWIDSTSVQLPRLRWALPDESLQFSVRAVPGGQAWLRLGQQRVALAGSPGSETYRGSIEAAALEEGVCLDDGDGCLRRPEAPEVTIEFVAALDGDTARLRREIRLRVLEPARLPVAELREAPDTIHGQSGVVVGRPVPRGPYAWRFPDGTRAEVTGRRGDRLRLAVPGSADAWVDEEDAMVLAEGAARPRAVVGDLDVEPRADRLSIHVPASSPVPATVSRPDPRQLVLRLHGARAATERLSYGPGDPFLESVRWTQEDGPSVRIELRLSDPLWGYRLRWRPESAEGAAGLVLEVRSRPTIDPEAPLRDRRIAVDPGHPGAGAYGPTGYYEGDANLAIARRLVSMLRQEGARPVLVREDTLPVGLYERTNRAVDAGAELFVSIHNNALPDGVYPFGEEGTSTYYYHPHARELAAAVQAGMLRHMGLRDLGVFWGNLAVARLSWMPSVLAEGAFMMMPRHEAALKTPEFQRAYARGVLEGLKRFLAARATEGRRAAGTRDPTRRDVDDRRREEP